MIAGPDMAPISDSAFESLRDRVARLETQYAVKTATDEAIQERLAKIESTLSRLTWLLITGIGGGVVAFILQGGLNIPHV